MTTPKIAILVNTQACSQKAFNTWKKIEAQKDNFLSTADIKLVKPNDTVEFTQEWVKKNLSLGTTKFISAGGDGTLNILLNFLIKSAQALNISLEELTLGAIGLGSSNDFHKPFNKKLAGFPCRINWQRTALKDIMFCSYSTNKNNLRYFIINSSIGITAQANYLFNFSPPWLSRIKKISTNLAIVCAGIFTVLKYKNLLINLSVNKHEPIFMLLTNLAAVKNRNFAGVFRYDQGAESHNNYFMLHLCQNMRKYEAIKTLLYLARGRFAGLHKTRSLVAEHINKHVLRAYDAVPGPRGCRGRKFPMGRGGFWHCYPRFRRPGAKRGVRYGRHSRRPQPASLMPRRTTDRPTKESRPLRDVEAR